MEKTNDRISELPDSVLHYILSLIPIKLLIRTSILSRGWRNVWKHVWAYATTLDFGVEFATDQTPEEFVATVNRYLQLHKRKEIKMFRLFFNLKDQYLSDAEKWVEFAVARGVKELDINFCQIGYNGRWDPYEETRPCKIQNSLFSCNSITHLNLSRFDFSPLLNINVYTYLKTLHLSLVSVTDTLLESMLSNCPLLEELSLRECGLLTHVKVSSLNLALKTLTVVDCSGLFTVEIFAPNLQSFCYCGHLTDMSFKNISSLVDVLVYAKCGETYVREDDWIPILCHLEHVKIMTLCNVSLEYVVLAEELTPEYLPGTFYNLQELQLVMYWAYWGVGCYLCNIYCFFENCRCPCLEKLFIKLPSAGEDSSDRDCHCERLLAENPPEIAFDHLKEIKMNGFRGLKKEMQLVKFFLENAIVLELLVLVAQKGVRDMKDDSASESKSIDEPLCLLHERLLILAKASSSDARILLCEYSDDDGALVPMHTVLTNGSFVAREHIFFDCSL